LKNMTNDQEIHWFRGEFIAEPVSQPSPAVPTADQLDYGINLLFVGEGGERLQHVASAPLGEETAKLWGGQDLILGPAVVPVGASFGPGTLVNVMCNVPIASGDFEQFAVMNLEDGGDFWRVVS
jgi:hypothetical protein